MVLGYLLARAGLNVTVLEKHADFLRDFRGDTIHPSTITVLRDLGLAERFLDLPLSRVPTMDAVVDGSRFTAVDFSTLPGPDDFLVFAPQWDFLDFLASEGARLPGFDLRMRTAAHDLLLEDHRIVGVRASDDQGEVEIRATLTVAADGRTSVLRQKAELVPVETGVPIDVLWFRLPKPQDPPPTTLGYVSAKGLVLTLERGDYYQAGTVIPKGRFAQLRAQGLDAFRARLATAAPPLTGVVDALEDWDQIKLLSVQLNHLPQWHRPGFVAIGDAAHAMSPVFGVGVNYAIQDAVALSNAIADDLAAGTVPEAALARVQARRERPVRAMQRIQRFAHRGLGRVTRARGDRFMPRPIAAGAGLLQPLIQRTLAQLIGYGFLPERPDLRDAVGERPA
jgi:2-polyprenyl-6-methoxyphenol hydroxylase-like FAD-dependent oxidoreductase